MSWNGTDDANDVIMDTLRHLRNLYDDDDGVFATTTTTTTTTGESFDDYEATTTDPGCILFVIALVICTFSILVLPLCVRLLRRNLGRDGGDGNGDGGDDTAQQQQHPADVEIQMAHFEISEMLNIVRMNSLRRTAELEALDQRQRGDGCLAMWYTDLTRSHPFIWALAKFDNETRRILDLAVPFTFSAVAYNASSVMILAIISHSLGTDDMLAYTMVGLIIGTTSSFLAGWIEAVSSLGSMAYGAGNYKLLGQYLQISCIAYTVCEVPMAIIWFSFTGKILLLMGFDESVATIGQKYVWVTISINIVYYWNMAVMEVLEVIGKQSYANIMYCVSCLMNVGLVALCANLGSSLVTLGIGMLVTQILLFYANNLIPAKMGWLMDFDNVMFRRKMSTKSLSVAKSIFQVAVPLAFGNLLAYAEWEILTIFAAILGPAEVATWAILGSVWGLFESTTGAIKSASELRVAFHLGNGHPDMAKLSGYKAMLLAAIVTGSASIAFLCLTTVLPPLLTYDATIQGMLVECFPLVALGNVTMSTGMVCWAIVGAQGRYKMATTIAMACAFGITLPTAALLTYLRIDLQGLTFSVVVGYTITAMILSVCVLTSDWKTLAEQIKVAVDELDDTIHVDDSAPSSTYLMNVLSSPLSTFKEVLPGTTSKTTLETTIPYTPPTPSSTPSLMNGLSSPPCISEKERAGTIILHATPAVTNLNTSTTSSSNRLMKVLSSPSSTLKKIFPGTTSTSTNITTDTSPRHHPLV